MLIEKLNEVFESIYKELGANEKANIVVSARPELCDYQCNDVFKLSKLLGKNPLELGETIINKLNSREDINNYFDKIEFVKPGFINLSLSASFINNHLTLYNDSLKNSIKINENPDKIVIDYGGPNVAKPLHVGHMRTALVGESIKRILKYFNNEVIADVHLGDIGLQIGQVIYHVIDNEVKLEDINLEYLNWVYPHMSGVCKEDDDLKDKCAQITKELQEGNEKYINIWKVIYEVSVNEIKANYAYLDVNFDLWYGEYDALKYLDKTTEIFKEVIIESDKALVIDISLDEDKNPMPPLLYRKSNGAYLYGSTDLATIVSRVEEINPNKIFYVTDLRQALHFKQVFRACDKINYFKLENFEHLGYGTVNGEDNKPYKTRSGDTPKLVDLFASAKEIFINKREENKNLSNQDLDIIVNSILKFADLSNSREKDYIFDLDKFSEVNGKTGPYILYTYLRINKILEGYNEDGFESNDIYNNYDKDLRLKLLEIGKTLECAYNERKPNYIADYLYNICQAANVFYQNNHIAGEIDEIKKKNYLFLLKITNKYIKELLDLLVIKIPTKM